MMPGCCYCDEIAEAWWQDTMPVCLECADLLIERIEALATAPQLQRLLPLIGDRVPGL